MIGTQVPTSLGQWQGTHSTDCCRLVGPRQHGSQVGDSISIILIFIVTDLLTESTPWAERHVGLLTAICPRQPPVQSSVHGQFTDTCHVHRQTRNHWVYTACCICCPLHQCGIDTIQVSFSISANRGHVHRRVCRSPPAHPSVSCSAQCAPPLHGTGIG